MITGQDKNERIGTNEFSALMFTSLLEQKRRIATRLMTAGGAGVALMLTQAEYFSAAPSQPWPLVLSVAFFSMSLFLAFVAETDSFGIAEEARAWERMRKGFLHTQWKSAQIRYRRFHSRALVGSILFFLLGFSSAAAGILELEVMPLLAQAHHPSSA